MKTVAGDRGMTVKTLSGGELGWGPALVRAISQVSAIWGERVGVRTMESGALLAAVGG